MDPQGMLGLQIGSLFISVSNDTIFKQSLSKVEKSHLLCLPHPQYLIPDTYQALYRKALDGTPEITPMPIHGLISIPTALDCPV